MESQSSNGLLNPEDEVAKYFKVRTLFEECGDDEIKSILETENKREEEEGHEKSNEKQIFGILAKFQTHHQTKLFFFNACS